MYNIREQSGKVYTYVSELACDTVADLQTIPQNVAPGSVAIIIATSQVFMKNSEGTWVELEDDDD